MMTAVGYVQWCIEVCQVVKGYARKAKRCPLIIFNKKIADLEV